jgi:superoxide reductase
MTKLNQIYQCGICGNMVEVVNAGVGELVCCGKPMKLLEEKTEDQGFEKHVPVVEKTAKGIKVKVGSIPHPMEDKHFIQWIQVIADGKIYRKHLKPGDKPEAEFCIDAKEIVVREFCNIHGLWKA